MHDTCENIKRQTKITLICDIILNQSATVRATVWTSTKCHNIWLM